MTGLNWEAAKQRQRRRLNNQAVLEDPWVKIKASRRGRCAGCEKAIYVGEGVKWHRFDKRLLCGACQRTL